jgi:hypothetical protein
MSGVAAEGGQSLWRKTYGRRWRVAISRWRKWSIPSDWVMRGVWRGSRSSGAVSRPRKGPGELGHAAFRASLIFSIVV